MVAFADTLFDAGFKLNTDRDGVIWTHRVKDPLLLLVLLRRMMMEQLQVLLKSQRFLFPMRLLLAFTISLMERILRNELQYLIDNNINKQGEYQLTDALQNMLDKGLKFVTNDVKEWLDCGNKNATVNTNERKCWS